MVKKGGSFRLCLDFREINKLTNIEVCGPPSIEESIDAMSNMTFFSRIDLKDGYHHIVIDENSREITAFTTPIGRFQFVRMPFGLRNAPSTFQAIMYTIFAKYIMKTMMVYMDDIIVFSKSEKQHKVDLRNVLMLLAEVGFKINLKKCEFMRSQISFLGFIIDKDTIRINCDRFTGLNKRININTKKDLQRALGFLGYFRKFIKGYTDLTHRLYKIIADKENLDKKAEEEINTLRLRILECDPLNLPNFEHPFVLECDASNVGLGVALIQEIDKVIKPIGFAGRKLISAEINYTITEKELLSIIFGIKKFRFYLFKEFKIITDHEPLKWLKSIKNPEGRIARWKMFLQNYEYKIVYRKGKDNILSDFISRLYTMKLEGTNDQIVKRCHLITGHSGRDALYHFIRRNTNYEISKNNIAEIIKKCDTCTKFKNQQGLVIFNNEYKKFFEKIGIDCMGPLPKSASGKKYIILITDYSTNYVEGISVKSKTAKNIAGFILNSIIFRYGPPKEIQMDSGREFLNKTIADLGRLYKSKLRYSTPYHPQANGLAERTNKSIINKLSKIIHSKIESWDKFLQVSNISL